MEKSEPLSPKKARGMMLCGQSVDKIVGEPVLQNRSQKKIPEPYYDLLICGPPLLRMILANTENTSPFEKFIPRKCAIAFCLLAQHTLPCHLIDYILSFKLWGVEDVNGQNYFGMTPLQCAVLNANHTGNYEGAVDAVKELIEWGADASVGNVHIPNPFDMIEALDNEYRLEMCSIRYGPSVDACYYTNKFVGIRNHILEVEGLSDLWMALLG